MLSATTRNASLLVRRQVVQQPARRTWASWLPGSATSSTTGSVINSDDTSTSTSTSTHSSSASASSSSSSKSSLGSQVSASSWSAPSSASSTTTSTTIREFSTPPPPDKNVVTKKDLVAEIAATHELSLAMSERILNTVLDTIVDSVSEGNVVQLSKFGTFQQVERQGRNGVNPKTLEKIWIEPKTSVKFKAYTAFKKSVA